MKASIVQLRYQMRDILRALRRNEEVKIFYHGKAAGVIIPIRKKGLGLKVRAHSFFGASKASRSKKAIQKTIEQLRGNRYRDL